MAARSQTFRRWPLALLLLISASLHVVIAEFAWPILMSWRPDPFDVPVSVQLVDGDALDAMTPEQVAALQALERKQEEEKKPEEEKEEEEPDKKMPDGQVVETVKPPEEKKPIISKYLAEHDNAVKEETRTEAFKVNPEVLSNMYSRESKMEFEDLADVGAKDVSTGATVGNLSNSAPGKGPPKSLIPSPWAITNKEGLAAPTRASSKDQSLAGAPQNDLLDAKLGDAVSLNTREFVGSAYINRIKRMVNFYWSQNLDNLSPSVRLAKPHYTTVVAVVLSAEGTLETLSVTTESGLVPIDDCVVQAFRTAGPFPNPPEQLVKRDGRVYLDDLSFTVDVGQAKMQYQGIDPRAGVQFPGILKSPR